MFLASCGDNPLAAVCCTDFKPGTNMASVDWGLKGSAQLEFGASMQAIGDFGATATAMVTDLGVACKGLAVDLGVDEHKITDTDPNKFMTGWCSEAATAIGTLKAQANIQFNIQPARCDVNVSAKVDCEAQCSGSASCTLTPGEIKASCEPGKLSGGCSGKCTGSCEGSATLAVNCNSQCSGTCEGTCNGTATPQGGASCSGTCAGTCRGSCQVDGGAMASCSGTCSGSCDVDFTAPKCNGKFTPPSGKCQASANCSGSCDASASAKAECTPPQVGITASAGFEAKIAALQKWLPKIYEIIEGRLVVLNGQIKGLAEVSGNLKAGLSGDAKAVFCIVPAVAAVGTAGENIAATVTAAASISGKVGG
jgi:hypothetical protein